jgi:hypothetical protein
MTIGKIFRGRGVLACIKLPFPTSHLSPFPFDLRSPCWVYPKYIRRVPWFVCLVVGNPNTKSLMSCSWSASLAVQNSKSKRLMSWSACLAIQNPNTKPLMSAEPRGSWIHFKARYRNLHISAHELQIVLYGILFTSGYINPSRLAAFAFPIIIENYDIQKTMFRIYGLRSSRSEIN